MEQTNIERAKVLEVITTFLDSELPKKYGQVYRPLAPLVLGNRTVFLNAKDWDVIDNVAGIGTNKDILVAGRWYSIPEQHLNDVKTILKANFGSELDITDTEEYLKRLKEVRENAGK